MAPIRGEFHALKNRFILFVTEGKTDVLNVFEADTTGPRVGRHIHEPSFTDHPTAIFAMLVNDVRDDMRSPDVSSEPKEAQ